MGYDLEERAFAFAVEVRSFLKKLPKTTANLEDGRQLVRSSGSVGANYIEANEKVSKADFIYRIRVCKKEAKESTYWLRLIDSDESVELDKERQRLMSESVELAKIFGAILKKWTDDSSEG